MALSPRCSSPMPPALTARCSWWWRFGGLVCVCFHEVKVGPDSFGCESGANVSHQRRVACPRQSGGRLSTLRWGASPTVTRSRGGIGVGGRCRCPYGEDGTDGVPPKRVRRPGPRSAERQVIPGLRARGHPAPTPAQWAATPFPPESMGMRLVRRRQPHPPVSVPHHPVVRSPVRGWEPHGTRGALPRGWVSDPPGHLPMCPRPRLSL